ncbi:MULTISPECIES: hypothetical protein [unclassified Marinovum]
MIRQIGRNALAALVAVLVMAVLMVAVLTMAGAAQAQSVEVDLRAAWGGFAAQNRFSEIEVGVSAAVSMPVTLDFPEAAVAIRAHLRTRAGERVAVAIPYAVAGPADVLWRLSSEGRVLAEGRAQVFGDVDGGQRSFDLTGVGGATRLPAAALPQTAMAYDTVERLIVTQSDLRRLGAAQMTALEGFLQRCGALTIAEANPAVLHRLQGVAGCGGRNIGTDPTQPILSALPLARDLVKLSDCRDCGGQWGWLVALATACAALLLAAAVFFGLWAASAVGVVFAALLLVGPPDKRAFVEWIEWTHATPGAATGAQKIALVVHGRGNAPFALPLPQTAIPDLPLPPGARLEVGRRAGGGGATLLTLRQRWMGRQQVGLSSVGTVSATTPIGSDPRRAEARLAARIGRRIGVELRLVGNQTELSQPFPGVRRALRAEEVAQ